MNKLLVIGASSFSGQHFCRFAEARGVEVYRGSVRYWNLPQVSRWSHVVNFSALNVVAPSWEYADDYMTVNAVKPLQLWNYLQELDHLEKYVHISTPEVYGSTRGAIDEAAPFNPSTPYAVSRAAAEMMARCYYNQYQFPVVFTRACNVYGPGQQLYRLIPKLIVSIRKGLKFPLEGSGMSTRAFLHVDDLCTAVWKILEDGKPPQAYHISSLNTYRIRDIVSMVCHRMGVDFADAVTYTEERPGKDAAYNLNSEKLRAMGWTDRVDLRDGIEGMLRWVDENWAQLKDAPMDYEIQL